MDRQLYKRLLKAIVLSTLIFALVLAAPVYSWAAGAASNQSLDQPASLIAPEPDAKITVYQRPAVGRDKAGYGVSGDAVTVLEQVSDNQSLTWNHIRFDNLPYAEGWVQETFLALEKGEKGTVAAQSQSRRSQNQQSQNPQSQNLQSQNLQSQNQQSQSPQSQNPRSMASGRKAVSLGNRYLGNRQSPSNQRLSTGERLPSRSYQRNQN